MSHLAGLLNLQDRARRNALSATRVLRVRRADQVEADHAVQAAADASSPAERKTGGR